MRALIQKQNKSPTSESSYVSQNSIPRLKERYQANARKHSPQNNTNESKSGVDSSLSNGPKHSFGQVSVYAGSAVELQPKLTVNKPGDLYEQEADWVAEQVMHMPDPTPIKTKDEKKVQRKPISPDIAPAPQTKAMMDSSLGSKINSSQGGGSTMNGATQHFMAKRFGVDFSKVKVHADNEAAQMNCALSAKAFTAGNDIYFNRGEYRPDTLEGKHLLAHELTHTLQQNRSGITQPKLIQRKVNAIRFSEDATLEDISDGKKVLKEGDKEPAVIKITQAVSELGFYPISIIDERFDPPLTLAIEKYQIAKLPAGKAIKGQVDKITFTELDKEFQGTYFVEKDLLGKQKSAHLLKGTDSLTAAEKKESERVISTEPPVNPVTGLPPVFKPSIVGKGKYEDRLRTIVDKEILSEYNSMGKGKAAAHANPSKIYDWKQIDTIAAESQKAVDTIFGEYKKGPAMKGGVTIMDAWADKEKQLAAGGKAKEDRSAAWRVNKILTGDSAVKALDREHGAIQSRAPEKAFVDAVRLAMLKKYRKELIETHKGWPGYEDSGRVFIQLFKAPTDAGNRRNMWDYFQTFIHEYIHSSEHPDHIAYRTGKGEQKGGFVLREGTTDYFTKIVWNSITITPALRKTIEGPFHDPGIKFKIQSLNTYDESKNAERLAGVVGIRNLAAAFFLGKVDLIGKP